MKNTFKVIGTLTDVTRYDTSHYGNPRYVCVVTGNNGESTTFYTMTDSMLGYSVPNFYGKQVELVLGEHYNKVCVKSIVEV